MGRWKDTTAIIAACVQPPPPLKKVGGKGAAVHRLQLLVIGRKQNIWDNIAPKVNNNDNKCTSWPVDTKSNNASSITQSVTANITFMIRMTFTDN